MCKILRSHLRFFANFALKIGLKLVTIMLLFLILKTDEWCRTFWLPFLAKTCGKFFKIQSSLTPTTAWFYLWSEILPLWCCFSAVLCSFIFHLFVISHFFSPIHISNSFFLEKPQIVSFSDKKIFFFSFSVLTCIFLFRPTLVEEKLYTQAGPILADRYIHRRNLWAVSLENSSIVENI